MGFRCPDLPGHPVLLFRWFGRRHRIVLQHPDLAASAGRGCRHYAGQPLAAGASLPSGCQNRPWHPGYPRVDVCPLHAHDPSVQTEVELTALLGISWNIPVSKSGKGLSLKVIVDHNNQKISSVAGF